MATQIKVSKNMRQVRETIEHQAQHVVLRALIVGGSEVAGLTPVATSNLLNSQFRSVGMEGGKVVGTFAYTASYAAAVHSKPGRLLGQKVPRSPRALGFVWGPSAEPHFVTKGFENAKPNIDQVIEKGMKV